MVVSSAKFVKKSERPVKSELISPIRDVTTSVSDRSVPRAPLSPIRDYIRAPRPERVSLPDPELTITRQPTFPDPELTITRQPTFPAEGSMIAARNALTDFHPTRFDPKLWSFKMVCLKLGELRLDPLTVEIIRSNLVRFSLNIYNFPPCPEEDLMLAVYFFFEEMFHIAADIEVCVRYCQDGHSNLVGVVLSTIPMIDELLSRAPRTLQNSRTKLIRNSSLDWIVHGLRKFHTLHFLRNK